MADIPVKGKYDEIISNYDSNNLEPGMIVVFDYYPMLGLTRRYTCKITSRDEETLRANILESNALLPHLKGGKNSKFKLSCIELISIEKPSNTSELAHNQITSIALDGGNYMDQRGTIR